MTERTLAHLIGHDDHARRKIAALTARYMREGLHGLRASAQHLLEETTPEESVGILVEAVLLIAEQAPLRTRIGRRAWEDFDAAEARDEAHLIHRGGNR